MIAYAVNKLQAFSDKIACSSHYSLEILNPAFSSFFIAHLIISLTFLLFSTPKVSSSIAALTQIEWS